VSSDDRPPSNPPPPDPTRLVFGFAPPVEGDRTRQALVELCRALGAALSIDVAPMRVTSYGALERAILEERASFGWLPPVVLARLELSGRVLPIVQCQRAGAVNYQTCLFTRTDGPERIEDLAGVRAVWVDRSSAAGFVFPRLLLASRGIKPRDAFSQETFVQSHAEVVRAVVAGEADVGATFATLDGTGRIVRGGWTEPDGSNPKPIRVLGTFGPIPSDAMAVSTALPAKSSEALAKALVALGSTPSLRAALRHLFGADALVPIEPAAYAPLRGLVAKAQEEGLAIDG
jgi:ABC-type phosphate/phosphonate transport system substrate-binding protein